MKRGIFFLGPEVMKILIAVISIAVLIGLAVSLGGILIDKQRIEQARGNLDNLVATINSMGVEEIRDITLQGIKGSDEDTYWSILGYSAKETIKPEVSECKGSCVCLCGESVSGKLLQPNTITDEIKLERAKGCKSSGVCLPIEQEEVIVESIIIPSLDSFPGDNVEYNYAPRITFFSGEFRQIKILKREKSVQITSKYYVEVNR